MVTLLEHKRIDCYAFLREGKGREGKGREGKVTAFAWLVESLRDNRNLLLLVKCGVVDTEPGSEAVSAWIVKRNS